MFHVLTKRLQPQKKRNFRFLVPPSFSRAEYSWFYTWAQVVAQSRGLVSWRLVERVYIWGKRIVHYPHQRARFWVNLQCNVIFTRKGKNSRMGKGKGSQSGRLTRVSPGALLIAFSCVRPGLLIRLLRQLRVRCPLSVSLKVPCYTAASRPLWIKQKRARRRYARLASARAWGKVRRFKQQRIFEFITLVFFWLQKRPTLPSNLGASLSKPSLVASRFQSAGLRPLSLTKPVRWV
jgi:ribosomal protein L16/L10AE